MKCPRCGLIVTDAVPRCHGCAFHIADMDALLPSPPSRRGLINDFAAILTPPQNETLENVLSDFSREHHGEMVLVTCPSSKPVKPAEYVFWLFNRWKVGGEEHRGLMILLSLAERRIECEVGYSWEPIISDALSDQLLASDVVPFLQKGDYFGALQTAVDRFGEIFQNQTTGLASSS